MFGRQLHMFNKKFQMFMVIDALYKSLPRETSFLNPTTVTKELDKNSLIRQKVL
jgi:hypothetical protein